MPFGSLITLPGIRHLRVLLSAVAAVTRGREPGLTLDLLRSQLSHEIAAKIARLSGLLAEWRTGRYRPQDPEDAAFILDDIEALVLAHARLAAAEIRTFRILLGVQSSLCRLRALLRPAGKGKALSIHRLDRFGRGLERLRERCRSLVELLSLQMGLRLAEVVNTATDEIRREIGGGLVPGTVSIVCDESAGGSPVWISRADAPIWHDLFKNMIRNAVEATEEKLRAAGTRAEPFPADPPTVSVSLSSSPARAGQVVEIRDSGVGISEENLARIWKAGSSRHGKGRGQGLTEGKKEFLDAHASLEVRSLPDVGTTFRIAVPHETIPARQPPPWRLRSLTIPAAAVLLAGLTLLLSTRPRLESVRVVPPSNLAGYGLRGELLWNRDFSQEIMRNYLYGGIRGGRSGHMFSAGGSIDEGDQALLLRDGKRRIRRIAVSTQPSVGAGVFWLLDAAGGVRRRLPLCWQAPDNESLGKLMCLWMTPVDWDGLPGGAIALQIRDNRYSPTCTRFMTWEGDSLGAYYHWGHLVFRAAADLDGDGRTEILLCGINNYAQQDTTIFAHDPGVYIDCMVLLEVPRVSGQSYPHLRWPGMPAAKEDAYLLFPPLADGIRPAIYGVEIVPGKAGAGSVIEVSLQDGRIYGLDGSLRPRSCRTGDFTEASRRELEQPIGPLVYFNQGVRSDIRLSSSESP